MRYNQIRKMDIVDGPGIRVSIFTQGCPFHCVGCFNSETWDYLQGKYFTEDTKNLVLKLCSNEHISGLSILGGEPLINRNLEPVSSLCKEFKDLFPNKTIWIWTGFTFESLSMEQKNSIRYADVLIDGPFEIDKADFNLKYRGSSNQRILDINKSLTLGIPQEFKDLK